MVSRLLTLIWHRWYRLWFYEPEAHNHDVHGKGLDVKNNQLVSYFSNSQDRTERERNVLVKTNVMKCIANRDDSSVIHVLEKRVRLENESM